MKKEKQKTGFLIGKRLGILLMVFVLAYCFNYGLTRVFLGSKSGLIDKKVYAAENQDKKLYVYYWGIDPIENTFTEDNPFIMTTGEDTIMYAQYTAEEYNQVKNTICPDVYNNSANVFQKVWGDTWDDGENRVVFCYKAANSGKCKLVIRKTDEPGTELEAINVKVVDPQSIYVIDNENGERANPGSIDVEIGQEYEFYAVLTAPLNMDGDKPSEAAFYGSGFWSGDPISVTNEWTKLEYGPSNTKWIVKAKCKPNSVGTLKLNLAKNGTNVVDEIYLNVKPQNNIEVNNIKIGNQTYSEVNKNVATKMFNGKNMGDNSEYNRYIVNVGDKLEVSADNPSGLHYELSNTQALDIVSDSQEDNGKVKATYKGATPGTVELNLKDDSGVVYETFYVEVKYPINVNTAIGETSKDTVHEYINTAIGYVYDDHPQGFLSDPDMTPLYVKNEPSYTFFYYLTPEDTVILSTYVKDGDNSTFTLTGGLEFVPLTDHNYTEEEESYVVKEAASGDKEGYTRIIAEVKLNSTSGIEVASVGNTNFFIAPRDIAEKVHHFDLEIADGGSYTVIETTKLADGSREVVKTLYNANLTRVHGSEVYDKDGNILAKLEENEYWQNHDEGMTQFESTSAYVTNENGNLIDERGNVIDDEVRSGARGPLFKNRDVPFAEIENVKFFADIRLAPIQRITTKYDKDGNIIGGESDIEDISSEDVITLNDTEVNMGKRDIIDAFNKCPNHSGLDFTARIMIDIEHKVGNLNVTKTVQGNDSDEEFTFKITLLNEDGSVNTSISGTYGDIEFKDGVAVFTLKNGENKLILNLPAGIGYVIEETDSKGYTVVASGETGTIESDETLLAEFLNKREEEKEEQKESKNPKTSDEVLINVISFVLSIAVVIVMMSLRKKSTKNHRRHG